MVFFSGPQISGDFFFLSFRSLENFGIGGIVLCNFPNFWSLSYISQRDYMRLSGTVLNKVIYNALKLEYYIIQFLTKILITVSSVLLDKNYRTQIILDAILVCLLTSCFCFWLEDCFFWPIHVSI